MRTNDSPPVPTMYWCRLREHIPKEGYEGEGEPKVIITEIGFALIIFTDGTKRSQNQSLKELERHQVELFCQGNDIRLEEYRRIHLFDFSSCIPADHIFLLPSKEKTLL